MSLADENQNTEITISDLINFCINNFARIIIYFLIPLLIGLSILFYLKPIVSEEKTFALNMMIQDEIISQDISKSYFFSEDNLKKALVKSRLNEKISVNRQLLDSFDLISGHTDLSKIVDDYLSRDFLSLTKQLYFNPEEIENLRKDLVSKGNSFKTLIFRSNSTILSDTEVSILISNLVDVINDSISADYDLAKIALKEIQILEVDSPISTMDVNKLNNRLVLIREYIDILNREYASFAPDINLKVYLSNLESSEDLFNYLIQENEIYRDIIESRIKLDIISAEKTKAAAISQLNILTSSEENNNISNSETFDQNVSLDSSFIDTILSLGMSANALEDKKEIIDRLNVVEIRKINLERRLADLDLKTNFFITTEEARDYLINSLNNTTSDINSYIRTVHKVKAKNSPIAKLSYANVISSSSIQTLFTPLLYIFLGSLAISFLFVTLRIARYGIHSK